MAVRAVNIEELYNRQMHEVVAPRTAPALLKGPYSLEQGMYSWRFAPAELPSAPPIPAGGGGAAGHGTPVFEPETKKNTPKKQACTTHSPSLLSKSATRCSGSCMTFVVVGGFGCHAA